MSQKEDVGNKMLNNDYLRRLLDVFRVSQTFQVLSDMHLLNLLLSALSFEMPFLTTARNDLSFQFDAKVSRSKQISLHEKSVSIAVKFWGDGSKCDLFTAELK